MRLVTTLLNQLVLQLRYATKIIIGAFLKNRPFLKRTVDNMSPETWKQTSEEERRHIINLYPHGKSYRVIAEQTGRCPGTCFNVVRDYERNRAVKTERKRSLRPRKVTQAVFPFIEYHKWKKSYMFCREIRQKLLDGQVCTINNVPSMKKNIACVEV